MYFMDISLHHLNQMMNTHLKEFFEYLAYLLSYMYTHFIVHISTDFTVGQK